MRSSRRCTRSSTATRETFKGYGHNAHPVFGEGVVCDACNGAIVLPQRFRKWAP